MPDKPTPVEEYLASQPAETRKPLEHLRAVIKSVVPDAEEVISYNLPAFRYQGKVVAGFAAAKNHLAYYPFSGSITVEFADELKEFKGTVGSIHFSATHPIPDDLVRRMVESRIAASR